MTARPASLDRKVVPAPVGRDLAELVRAVVGGGGEYWVRGAGWSMHPTIRSGDDVLLVAPRGRPRVGDVVLVDADVATLHRVLQVRGSRVLTAGDNTCAPDGWVPLERVAARASAARHGTSLVALEPTLRHGVGALVRGLALLLRLQLARVKRTVLGRHTPATS